MKFIIMVWLAFFTRHSPDSTIAKPACMNMTRKPQIKVQTKLIATLFCPTWLPTSPSVTPAFASVTVTSAMLPVRVPPGSPFARSAAVGALAAASLSSAVAGEAAGAVAAGWLAGARARGGAGGGTGGGGGGPRRERAQRRRRNISGASRSSGGLHRVRGRCKSGLDRRLARDRSERRSRGAACFPEGRLVEGGRQHEKDPEPAAAISQRRERDPAAVAGDEVHPADGDPPSA